MKKEKKVAIKIFSSRNEKKNTHTHKKVTTGSATLKN